MKNALEIPMNRTPVTPHMSPGTSRRYSLYRTIADAAVARIVSHGSHIRDRDGEQHIKSTTDSDA